MVTALNRSKKLVLDFAVTGSSVILETKSEVGNSLKDKFSDIILWHCLNHRLEFAIRNALEIVNTNDFQSFLQHLYSLYSHSPKNKWKLSEYFHALDITLKRIWKGVCYSLGCFNFPGSVSSLAFFSSFGATVSQSVNSQNNTKYRKS